MNKVWDKPYGLSKIFSGIFNSAGSLQIIAAVCGFIASKAQVLGGMHPFAVALAAGIDPAYYISATAGAAIGCMSLPLGEMFRHIAALFAVVSIRYLMARYTPKIGRALWSALLCLGTTVLTGMVAASISLADSLPIFAEGVLAGSAAYFISKSGKILPIRLHKPSETETAGAVIFLNIILIGLYSIELYGISPGRILAVALLLAAGRYGKTAGGAIAGISSAMAFLLSGGQPIGALSLAVGGVLAGLFCSLPSVASVVAVLLSTALLWVSTGLYEQALVALCEVATGGAVFFLLPKRICILLSGIFAPETSTPTLRGMQISIHSRLHTAAEAIFDVSHTVDEVADRLKEINSPSFEQTVSAVEKDACGGCCLCLECWETRRCATIATLVNACSKIRSGGFTADLLNDKYDMGCLRPIQVANALKSRYAIYSQRLDAEKRLAQVREIVSDQFCGISDMLYELSTEFAHTDCFDTDLAAAAAEALADMGITVEECGCVKDKDGRLSFEMKIPLISENINRADIVACLNDVCGRSFGAPKVIRGDNYLLLSVGEKPNFTAETGLCQLAEESSAQMCGDSANHFRDRKGNLYMVLSDGMGSGGRAAVDGALLSGLLTRMISAGFSTDSSLKISNAAMLFRSSDESMATADITSIDLYNGRVGMFKAGAAPTLVRKSGRTGIAESRSLPAGILRDITFDHASIDLDDGDIVLMMSDGAVSDGTDWICAELEKWDDGSATMLAHRIAEGARRRRTDGHADDITVMAAILRRTE